MIDLHNHLLFEMDDGAKSMYDSITMARIALEQGITKIAATSHFISEEGPDAYYEKAESKLSQLRQELSKCDLNLEVYSGAEVYISPFLMETERLDKLCINRSKYMLIELPMVDIPQYTEDVIYHLSLKGIVPIIAHPERNIRIMSNPNLLYPYISLGAMAQVNTGSITGFFGRESMKCARILFENNMAHYIATDAHSIRRRAPFMRDARNILAKWMGQEFAKDATETIPNAIINDLYLSPEEPKVYKKKFLASLFGI